MNKIACLALVVGIASACGSNSSSTGGTPTSPTTPSTPTAQVCRTYPTALSGSQTGTGVGTDGRYSMAQSTSFNSGTATLSGSVTRTQIGGTCNGTISATVTYRNVSDFVDEGKTSGRQMMLSGTSTSTNTGSCATPTLTTTTTHSYDGQGRLTGIVSTSAQASGQATTTYTAWDSAGRPTRATDSSGGSWSASYNDAALTTTEVTNTSGTSATVVLTYDSNNFLLSAVSTGTSPVGAFSITVTNTPTATAQVCK